MKKWQKKWFLSFTGLSTKSVLSEHETGRVKPVGKGAGVVTKEPQTDRDCSPYRSEYMISCSAYMAEVAITASR